MVPADFSKVTLYGVISRHSYMFVSYDWHLNLDTRDADSNIYYSNKSSAFLYIEKTKVEIGIRHHVFL